MLFSYNCLHFLPIPPQPIPPSFPTSTLPLYFVHVSFIVAPVDPSPHYPLPTPLWLLLHCSLNSLTNGCFSFLVYQFYHLYCLSSLPMHRYFFRLSCFSSCFLICLEILVDGGRGEFYVIGCVDCAVFP